MIGLILLLGIPEASAHKRATRADFHPGWRSREAYDVVHGVNEVSKSLRFIQSPDHAKMLFIEYDPPNRALSPLVWLTVEHKRYSIDVGEGVNLELAWAPDSKGFFANFSDGGSVGEYHVRVYLLETDGVKMVEPSKYVIQEALRHYPKCSDPETPNISAIKWFKDSSTLLVAAEVHPHTNCDSMGIFWAYKINLPYGEITKKYDQLEAKKKFWDSLGEEHRRAEDECIRDPKSCWVPTLHEKSR